MTILDEINSILFTRDPMRTGCVENDLFDEYVEEADEIAYYITDKSKQSIEGVVESVFEEFFWDDCLSDDEIADIATDIQLILAKHK